MTAFKIGIAIDFIPRVRKFGKDSKEICVISYHKIRDMRKQLKKDPEIPEKNKFADASTQTEDFGGLTVRFTMQDIFYLANNHRNNFESHKSLKKKNEANEWWKIK